MNEFMMLEALKVDLGITTSAYDNRLVQYLKAAQAAIETEGVTIVKDSLADGNLVVMYAAWLWRKRESGEGMSRMLRWALNNRLLTEKAKA